MQAPTIKNVARTEYKHIRSLRYSKICVVGLGIVGYPTASHIQKCGFSVCGYDVDKRKIANINPLPAFSEWDLVPECDAYIICVNTGWKDGKPDMSNIFDASEKIAERGKHKPLISIESTVSTGTCRKVAELFEDAHLVHVPHRYFDKESEKHGVKQLRVIGALDQESLTEGTKLYGSLGVPLHQVRSLEMAEMVKIAENAYRFVQIAFAEQLKCLCDNGDLPFEEIREAANTKWNIDILKALDGIGGDCLPKDIRFLMSLGEAPLLQGAIAADNQYRKTRHLRNTNCS